MQNTQCRMNATLYRHIVLCYKFAMGHLDSIGYLLTSKTLSVERQHSKVCSFLCCAADIQTVS